jgi:hypothetical protein
LVYISVDCTLGADDLTMSHLMACTERSIRESVYISIKRPLLWYDTLDALQKQTSPMITLSGATDIALQCKVSPDRVGTDILTDGQLADVGFLPNGLSGRLVCIA